MTGIEVRVARLAPTQSPDPERFAAAHAALLAATGYEADGRPDALRPDLDLAEGLLPDAHVVAPHVEVLVLRPPVAVRRRRLTRLASAAAAVLVVAAGLAVWPRPERFDAAAAGDRCVQWVVDHQVGAQSISTDGLRPVLAVRELGVEHVLVAGERHGGAGSVWECAFDGTPDRPGPQGYGAVGYGTPADRPAPARDKAEWVGYGGNGGDEGFVWGYAGDDVATLAVRLPDGRVVPAHLAQGYWVAWNHDASSDPVTTTAILWRLRDGTEHGPVLLPDTRPPAPGSSAAG